MDEVRIYSYMALLAPHVAVLQLIKEESCLSNAQRVLDPFSAELQSYENVMIKPLATG